jgi:hypothetical protein
MTLSVAQYLITDGYTDYYNRRKTMKTTRNIILALALFVAFAGAASAQGHGKKMGALSPENWP